MHKPDSFPKGIPSCSLCPGIAYPKTWAIHYSEHLHVRSKTNEGVGSVRLTPRLTGAESRAEGPQGELEGGGLEPQLQGAGPAGPVLWKDRIPRSLCKVARLDALAGKKGITRPLGLFPTEPCQPGLKSRTLGSHTFTDITIDFRDLSSLGCRAGVW